MLWSGAGFPARRADGAFVLMLVVVMVVARQTEMVKDAAALSLQTLTLLLLCGVISFLTNERLEQKDLVGAIVAACDETGAGAGEAPVLVRSQKEFLRDLLLAQGIQKTPGSELDDLLARYARL